MNKETFLKELAKINIILTEKQLQNLDKYYNLLKTYNEKVNLTRIITEEDVYLKHFYDSLTMIKVIDLTKDLKVCDIGTGAGFPGIVLKIVFPLLKITLVDSIGKKVNFLNKAIEELNLKDIEAINVRIEDYSKLNNEKFDLLVSRAVAKTNILLELGVKALKLNGYFILMKGLVEEELKDAKKATTTLGLKLIKKEVFNLPIEDSLRTLLVFEKIKKTDTIYPRDFKDIQKRPL